MKIAKIFAAVTLPVFCGAAVQIDPPVAQRQPVAVEAEIDEEDGGRIVGGEDASEGSAPWQIEIYSNPVYDAAERARDAGLERGSDDKLYLKDRKSFELRHKCGGSYIGGGWIVTAAHCVVGQKGPTGTPANLLVDRRIRMGSQNILLGQTYAIERVVRHKGYSKAVPKDDIALIKVREEGQTAKLAPGSLVAIDLQKKNDKPLYRNEILRVTGWGWMGARTPDTPLRLDTSNRVQRNPATLQQLAINVFEDSACANNAEYRGVFGKGTICAGSRKAGQDSCQGDSGGPLTRGLPNGKRVLVGIVSIGVGCAYKGIPAVYTRVSEYEKWIADAKRTAPKGVSQQ